MSKIRFSPAEDAFLRDNLQKVPTLYDLQDAFNSTFSAHAITYQNMQKRLERLGLRKGTHNVRAEKVHHRNAIGTIIGSPGHSARIKTENGYVPANAYFRQKHGRGPDEMPIHLNGDRRDFSEENIQWVSRAIYTSLCWRKWLFTDPELTRTAILTAQLLEFFPDLRHNENQFLRNRSDWADGDV